jgi:tetratricopeptide (TPR) repeat protein
VVHPTVSGSLQYVRCVAVDPKGLAVGIVQVALRALDKADVADMLGDLAGVPRRTPETVAYERFLRDVQTKLATLRRGAVRSHPSQAEEIDAALEQVRVRFETLLTSSGSTVAVAHLRPDEFRALVRDESAGERAQLGGVGPQVHEDALAHVTEAFILFAPSLLQFATVMLTVIADGVVGVQVGIERLEASGVRMEEMLGSALSDTRQALARKGPVRTGTLPGRAPDFVDTGILDRLTDQVARGGQATLVSLTGLRGVGKTQVAAEFARRCVADGWPVIAWVNAESQESLTTDLTVLANEVVGVREGETTETLLGRWCAAWNSDPAPRRLLVLDNLTDATHVRSLLPDTGAATVIATTSDAAAVISRHMLDVESWTPEQAVGYLTARTGLDDPNGALRVAEEVGFLPLALAQASWVIGQRRRRKPGYNYVEYVRELDELPLDRVLIAERGGEYPLKAAQVIELSVQTTLDACEGDSLVSAVLGVLTHLDPAGVPVAWLDVLDDVTASLNEVLDAMEAGALVTLSQDGNSIVMHRLVGRLLRDRPGTVWNEASGHVAEVLASVDPLTADGFWVQRQSATLLSSHVLAVLGRLAPGYVAASLVDIALGCGYALNVLHLPQTASILLEHLVVQAESVLGPDHPDTLASRNNLADAYESAGDLDRAIKLFVQVLSDTGRVLGSDHPDTFSVRNSLAGAYRAIGDLGRATPLFEQVLADTERVLGLDHPDTLMARNNVAYVYRAAGDLSRAIPLYEQSLVDHERVLGLNHPSTLMSRNNLAYAYESDGDRKRAIPLYERTLADQERVLGRDHPSTLMSRNNLAGACRAAGDLARAIPLHVHSLADHERVLGTDHPRTLTSRNNLAGAYRAAGDLGRATTLFEQNLTDTERILGPDHPSTLMSRGNLASTFESAGNLGMAISLFEHTFADSVRVLGPNHPDSLRAGGNLASAYLASGDLGQAIPLLEQSFAGRERTLGPGHPSTLISRGNLALALPQVGQQVRALELAITNWRLSAGRFGPADERTLGSHDTIGYIQAAAGNSDAATETWHSAHATALEHLGADHEVTCHLAGRIRQN